MGCQAPLGAYTEKTRPDRWSTAPLPAATAVSGNEPQGPARGRHTKAFSLHSVHRHP